MKDDGMLMMNSEVRKTVYAYGGQNFKTRWVSNQLRIMMVLLN